MMYSTKAKVKINKMMMLMSEVLSVIVFITIYNCVNIRVS